MTIPLKIISKEEYLKKNKRPDQEEVWDNISELWSEYKKKPFFTVENFLKGKKGKVIDLGCGSGRNMVASKDLKYYGVDFSSSQIKCAKKITKENGINAKLFKSSAAKLNPEIFKNEMFDYGLFIATLHCIEDKEDRLSSLKEFYRVLKPGSEGLISVWNSDDPRFNGLTGDIYMSWRKDGKEHMRYYYLYSLDELLDLLSSVGFKILGVKTNLDKDDSKIIATLPKDRFSKKNLIIRVGKR